MRVPGHSEIGFSEEADKLARLGSKDDLIGPDPAFLFPFLG